MSGTPVIRPGRAGEIPELKKIWMAVFGDEAAYVDGFFRRLYEPGAALVAEAGGEIATCVYLLPIGAAVLPGGQALPCTVSYAFATRPPFRGRGYGAAVAGAAVDRGFADGFPVSTICPAEDSLFGYYRSKVGYEDWFYTAETSFSRIELEKAVEKWGIEPVSAGEYGALRETLLAGRFHIRFSDRALAYQLHLCRTGGGDLYRLTRGNAAGCAAVERRAQGEMLVKELLLPDGALIPAALSGLIEFAPADIYTVRAPAAAPGGPGVRRFAMLRCAPGLTVEPGAAPPWYGFAFD